MISLLNSAESSLISLAVRLGGWLSPVPVAWTAYQTGVEVLDWPIPVAAAAAVALESLALATTATALEFRRYNLAKRTSDKTDPPAPVYLATATVTVYLTASMALVLLVHLWPSLIKFVPALFPVMTLTGVGTLALRDGHRARVGEAMEGAAQRRREAAERKARKARETKETEFPPVEEIIEEEKEPCPFRFPCDYEGNLHGLAAHRKKHINEIKVLLGEMTPAQVDAKMRERYPNAHWDDGRKPFTLPELVEWKEEQ